MPRDLLLLASCEYVAASRYTTVVLLPFLAYTLNSEIFTQFRACSIKRRKGKAHEKLAVLGDSHHLLAASGM